MTIRTRIAPSPTGELHIGTLRTVLYDYALAKKHNGQFIVRIEDTDRNRLVEGSMERLLQTIKDYGLNWDEGPLTGGPHEPYIQSERLSHYRKYALELVEKGHAYYCFCTSERLQKIREEQQAQGLPKTGYDKKCRSLSPEEVAENLKNDLSYVIRLKIPENEEIVLNDIIHGTVTFRSSEVEDMVILKSDGFPTYHLAAMVDDHLMNITHILRGVEWMPSSPLHVLIFKFLGWEMPMIAHLPNLKEKGMNQKLSKRFGSVEAAGFLKEGYLPEAVLNLLMFAGWNPGTEKEIYDLEDFVKDFSLEKVQKTDMVAFDRDKLVWLNGMYIRALEVSTLWERLSVWSQKYDVEMGVNGYDKDYILKVVSLIQERLKLFSEFPELSFYFFEEPNVDKVLLQKQVKDEGLSVDILTSYFELFNAVDEDSWNKDQLDEAAQDILAKKGYKPKEAFMTLRVAVSGVTATPPLFDMLEVLGREKTLMRIEGSLDL